jgi:bla regulator protein blaR1
MIDWAVETAIAVTVLLAAVLVLRHPVARLFGPRAAYALWALPALRMVLPALPEGAGLMLPAIPIDGAGKSMGAIMPQETLHMASSSPGLSEMLALWLPAAVAVWLGGAVIFLLVELVAYSRFRKRLLHSAVTTQSVAPGIVLIESAEADGPMALGVWHRLIVFPAHPATCFRADEQAMALAHELAHHQRGDLVANAIAMIFLAFHWWNPLAWLSYRAFRADQELACDADVLDTVAARGDLAAARQAYGRAIVKATGRRGLTAICHLNPVNILKRRLIMLAAPVRSRWLRRAGALTVVVAIVSGLALTASGPTIAAPMIDEGAPLLAEVAQPSLMAAAPAAPAPPAPPAAAEPPAAPEADAPPTTIRKGQLIILNRDGTRIVMRPDRDMTLIEAEVQAEKRAAERAAAAASASQGQAQKAEQKAQAEAEAAADRAEAAIARGRIAFAQWLAGEKGSARVIVDGNCEKFFGSARSKVETYPSNDSALLSVHVKCRRAIEAESKASALAGLERAREELGDLPDDLRARVREGLDRAIESLKAGRH